jgi:hypothetical protein
VDAFEHAFDQLRSYDGRPLTTRVRTLDRRVDEAWAAALISEDHDEQRRVAGCLVADALAVLAAVGGLPCDVQAAVDTRLAAVFAAPDPPRHTHVQGSRYRSCVCGQPPPGDAADRAAGDAADGTAGRPGRYPPGPAGDRLALLDLELTDDD